MATTRRDNQKARAEKKASSTSSQPDTYTDPFSNTLTFEQVRKGLPSLEQTVEKRTGIKAGGDRSMVLPYNKEMGVHVPEFLYGGIKGLMAPEQAREYGNVTPEEGFETAMGMMGSGMGISSLMRNPTGTMSGTDLGMQIGPRSRTYQGLSDAELQQLQQLFPRSKELTNAELRAVTKGRLNLSATGQNAFQEISDAKSFIKPKQGNLISKAIDSFLDRDVGKPMKLDEILEHPELYKAYPELRDLEFNFYRGDKKDLGGYNPKEKAVYVNKNTSKKDQYETVLHEIQHAIQDIEGIPMGANPEQYLTKNLGSRQEDIDLYNAEVPFYNIPKKLKQQKLKKEVKAKNEQDYRRNEGEANARATERRAKMTTQELRDNPVTYDVPVSEIKPYKQGGSVKMPKSYSKGSWKLI